MRFAITRVVLGIVLGYIAAVVLTPMLGVDPRWGTTALTLSSGIAGWVEFWLLRRALAAEVGSLRISGGYIVKLWGLAALSAAFEKKYGVKVKGWRAGSEKVLQRALTEARANRNDADVIETNGPELESLHREKVLQPLRSPHVRDLMPQAARPQIEPLISMSVSNRYSGPSS
jgi:spermidine/putrescine-binding protein